MRPAPRCTLTAVYCHYGNSLGITDSHQHTFPSARLGAGDTEVRAAVLQLFRVTGAGGQIHGQQARDPEQP